MRPAVSGVAPASRGSGWASRPIVRSHHSDPSRLRVRSSFRTPHSDFRTRNAGNQPLTLKCPTHPGLERGALLRGRARGSMFRCNVFTSQRFNAQLKCQRTHLRASKRKKSKIPSAFPIFSPLSTINSHLSTNQGLSSCPTVPPHQPPTNVTHHTPDPVFVKTFQITRRLAPNHRERLRPRLGRSIIAASSK
jgi:hypothetical protein